MKDFVIDRRFRGPPNSGNGGYVCGMLARHIDGAGEVTLHLPVPLAVPLRVSAEIEGRLELRHDTELIATARPVELNVAGLAKATFAEAEAASRMPPEVTDREDASGCFVCGPSRDVGDGLRILAGPLKERPSVYASHWRPGYDLAGDDGTIAPEFIWACLDCPTGHVVMGGDFGGADDTILLGRMAARLMDRPRPGDACVITAEMDHRSGRKSLANGALYGDDGRLLAFAQSTWITVPRSRIV